MVTDGLRQIRVTWPTRRQQSATCPSQHTKLMKRNQKPVKSAWGSTWTCIWWTSWSDADEICTNPRFRRGDPRLIWGWGLGHLNNTGRRRRPLRCPCFTRVSFIQPSSAIRSFRSEFRRFHLPMESSFYLPGAPEASCARRGAGRF